MGSGFRGSGFRIRGSWLFGFRAKGGLGYAWCSLKFRVFRVRDSSGRKRKGFGVYLGEAMAQQKPVWGCGLGMTGGLESARSCMAWVPNSAPLPSSGL